MSDLEQMRQQLMRDEGSVAVRGIHRPYTDTVGKVTIGYGRNLTDRGISEEEALHLLDNDIAQAIGELVMRFPWFAALDPVRQGVLVNMCVNLGITKLSKFVVTLAYIKKGHYENAAIAMLQSRWAEQVGNRALRLAEQMRTGRWI